MSHINDDKIKAIVQYDTRRQYYGEWTADNLYSTYRQFPRTATFDRPVRHLPFKVVAVNNDIICDTLWNEMSYNPGRFGHVSPFQFKGKNSVYRFCTTYKSVDSPKYVYQNVTLKPFVAALRRDATTNTIYNALANFLVGYMLLNADENGAWCADLQTDGGYIDIACHGGHSNDDYKKLSLLNDCIKFIAWLNVLDLDRKRGPYRNAIIAACEKKHPNGKRPARLKDADVVPVTPKSSDDSGKVKQLQLLHDLEIKEDTIYKKMDSLDITLDLPKGTVSPDLVDQARQEYDLYYADLVHVQAEIKSIRDRIAAIQR